ncbi:MAG: Rieske (2Fe-2S) protein [Luteimonas sp.]
MSTSLNHPADAARCDAAQVLADLDELDDGAIVEAETLVGGQVESLILHRDGDQVRAWLNVCPHAGRRLDWAPGKFLTSRDGLLVCAVHGASFELHAGECVAGPCRGERLRAVPVEVRDRKVWLLAGDGTAIEG